MNKICPLFKMAVIISNKPSFGKESEDCIGDKCQWWYLCSELDDYYLKEVKDVSE